MKMPVQWHEQCLKSMKGHAERATIDAALARVKAKQETEPKVTP